jgi:hypothetical protein
MTGLASIDITLVDDRAFGFGTFQSHNQKVVSNRNGLFMTHIRDRNEAYTAQQWRLSHSADGGTSFTTLYEATNATNPPVLETDAQDNLYLIRPDFVDRNAYLYRFLAAEGYARPHISCLPNGSAGKYCAFYDPVRQQLYYFAHNNSFHVVGLDGTVRRSCQLLQAGPDAVLQYPHLSLDLDGTLYAAWTTSRPDRYLYWDIHTMRSRDAGESWQTLEGASLTPPIVADNHGPTDRVSLDDEFEYHTWLASFMAKGGKLHFLYHYPAPGAPRQHYTRYDLPTARKDRDVWPEFRGDRLSPSHNDGFFAGRAAMPGSPLYCVLAQDGRLVCLASDDNGETWRDHAISEQRFAVSEEFSNPYAIGGCRELTAGGEIVGAFTDRIPDPHHVQSLITPGSVAPVYFFKIRTEA